MRKGIEGIGKVVNKVIIANVHVWNLQKETFKTKDTSLYRTLVLPHNYNNIYTPHNKGHLIIIKDTFNVLKLCLIQRFHCK